MAWDAVGPPLSFFYRHGPSRIVRTSHKCPVSGHRKLPNPRFGVFCVLGLVVLGGVEDELTEEFAGVGVDDMDA